MPKPAPQSVADKWKEGIKNGIESDAWQKGTGNNSDIFYTNNSDDTGKWRRIDTETDLEKMQKMRCGELLDNDEGESDEDEVDNSDSDNGRITCPHCGDDFNPSNDGVVEGDNGTLYCSIGCLNQDI